MQRMVKAFGLAVRKRRQKLGLSQERLAEIADIHRTYISSIELGKVAVGIEVCYKVAKALKTRLYKLIQEAEKSQG